MSTMRSEHLANSVTVRLSRPDDGVGLAKLAQLDSTQPPEGPLMVAEVAGELRAAVALHGGTAMADPFHHTADLVRLLEVRRQAVVRGGSRRLRRWRRFSAPVRVARTPSTSEAAADPTDNGPTLGGIRLCVEDP